jgi:DnaK suppressor protein
MTKQDAKSALMEKAKELVSSNISKEEIAIERTAEMFDQIQTAADRMLALDSLNRNWALRTEVERALERIEDGTYGICLACEKPIAERRLKAIPWVGLCIHCQELADRKAAALEWPEAA